MPEGKIGREKAREKGVGNLEMEMKHYGGEFKANVAIEAIRGEKTVNGLAGEYGVHPKNPDDKMNLTP